MRASNMEDKISHAWFLNYGFLHVAPLRSHRLDRNGHFRGRGVVAASIRERVRERRPILARVGADQRAHLRT